MILQICKICGIDCKSIRQLGCHIKSQHNISTENYYRQFYLTPGEDLCENCGKPLKFIKLTKPFGKTCSKECFGKNKLTKERRGKTNLEKFGSENPFAADSVKEQIKTKMIENYGGFGFGSTILKDKITSTNIDKFGVDNPWKNRDVINKLRSDISDKVEQFEKNNDCTERSKLIEIYGAGWLSIENQLDCIWSDNNHKFIKNYELDKIKEFGPKYCRPLTNDLELEIFEFIKSNYSNDIKQNYTYILNGKELDIYIPDLLLGIEIDGDYYHSDLFKGKDYHYNKSNLCRDKDVRLIHIQEYMWKNNPEMYKNYLLQLFTNRNYFEIKSQNNDYIILDYNFGLPQKIDNYDIYKFSGPIKLDNKTYNIYGCGNVIYKKN